MKKIVNGLALVLSWIWDATGGLVYSVWKQL
jgi:hypothetical protein